ncbi:MAG: GNAT family N-acetyltransferase [Myxococcales bacterium]|nr:GNAT family N-acetyltransferase [Myxococcota bacterium]MDW8284070.1 GNAT family N-acetyltransferase [Myxococcales bacterium]
MRLVCYRAALSAEPPAEAAARDALTYAAWGRALSQAQYLERERRLWAHPFSQSGLRRWVLFDGEQPVASCETYEVQVLVGGDRGRPRTGTAQGVASVFVEQALRGRGYARALLEHLHAVLRQEGAVCAYLISEIGPALYERLGYVARPLRLRRFSAPRPDEPEPGLEAVVWLRSEQIGPLLDLRYAGLPRSPLTLRLSPAQIGWHHERARFYAEVLGRPVPQVVGAACGPAFALWQHDLVAGLLRVLCLYPGPTLWAQGTQVDPRHPEAQALRNVLHGARAEAAAAGLGGVEIWQNPLMGWLRGGQEVPAADLPMMLPLAPGVRADDWLDWERGHWL